MALILRVLQPDCISFVACFVEVIVTGFSRTISESYISAINGCRGKLNCINETLIVHNVNDFVQMAM
jgi:hypothetical protein